MSKKEKQGQIMADVAILIGMLVLLCMVCRLWPILLLMILGIFVAALRILWIAVEESIRYGRRDEQMSDDATAEDGKIIAFPGNVTERFWAVEGTLAEQKEHPITLSDIERDAFYQMQNKVSELVRSDFPNAYWTWEQPLSRKEFMQGEDIFIRLGKAGGYRRAKVLYHNTKVIGLDYGKQNQPGAFAEDSGLPETELLGEEPMQNNYELLAFEWSEAHTQELEKRCNDADGQGMGEIMIDAEELPAPESWDAICKQIERSGLGTAIADTDGIIIIIAKSAERKSQ